MASKGKIHLFKSCCFTLSLFLFVFFLSSNQAEARETSISSMSESSTSMVATTTTTPSSLSWNLPKDWFKKPFEEMASFLNTVRKVIIDEMLKLFGLPPTGDILHYLITAVKWLDGRLSFFLKDPRARIDTVMEWIINSVMNPFRTLKDGMRSFQRLFRYLHRLKRGSYADFGKDNPIYRCYLDFYPKCVAKSDNGVDSRIFYQFYCAFLFYERCQLNYWWVKGKWHVPDINGELIPRGN